MSSVWSLPPVGSESNSFTQWPSTKRALQQDAENVGKLFRTFSCHSLPNFNIPGIWGNLNQRWKFSVGKSTNAVSPKLNRDAFNQKVCKLRGMETRPVSVTPNRVVPTPNCSFGFSCDDAFTEKEMLLQLQSLTLAMNSPLCEGMEPFPPDLSCAKQCVQTPFRRDHTVDSGVGAKEQFAVAPMKKATSKGALTHQGNTPTLRESRRVAKQTSKHSRGLNVSFVEKKKFKGTPDFACPDEFSHLVDSPRRRLRFGEKDFWLA